MFDTARTGTGTHGKAVYGNNLPGHIRSHHFHQRCLFGFGFRREERHVVPTESTVALTVTLTTSPVEPSTPIGTQSELAGLMAVCRGFFLCHLIVMTVPNEIRLAVGKKHTTRGEDRQQQISLS